MSQLIEVLELVQAWADRNNKILRSEMRKLKVGEKGKGDKELFFSLRNNVYANAGDTIQMDLSFMTHGRFRDMGAGSKSKIESQASNREIALNPTGKSKGRTPAKWYSKPFYGRLNALMGIVSGQIQETIVETIKQVEVGPLERSNFRKK